MKLSNTEAKILEKLEQAKGEVVPKLSFAVESESNVASNVLEVMVCRLRKKLNDGREIQTIRAVGYRLVTP